MITSDVIQGTSSLSLSIHRVLWKKALSFRNWSNVRGSGVSKLYLQRASSVGYFKISSLVYIIESPLSLVWEDGISRYQYEQLNYLYKWVKKKNRGPISFSENRYFSIEKNLLNKSFVVDLDLLLILEFYKHWFYLIQNNKLKNLTLFSF